MPPAWVNCLGQGHPAGITGRTLPVMSEFLDGARSRVAALLRMARTDSEYVRARIAAYAESTPEPPPLGRHGLATKGCSRCRGTMWAQHDQGTTLWVCAACGQVDAGTAMCPHCRTPMKAGVFGRDFCKTCQRVARPGDDVAVIEAREADRVEALRLLDAVIADRASGR